MFPMVLFRFLFQAPEIPMEIDAITMAAIGLLCTVLIWFIRLIASKTGWSPGLQEIGLISLIVSVILALVFVWKYLPPLPSSDPMEVANFIIVLAGSVLGFATLIYNIVFKKLSSWMEAKAKAKTVFREPLN